MTLKEEMETRRKYLINRSKVQEGVRKLLFKVQDKFPYILSFSFKVYQEGCNLMMSYHDLNNECIITTAEISLIDFEKLLIEELGFLYDLDYDTYVLCIDE